MCERYINCSFLLFKKTCLIKLSLNPLIIKSISIKMQPPNIVLQFSNLKLENCSSTTTLV